MKKTFFDIVMQRVADREGTILITTTPRGNTWLRKQIWNRRNDPDVYCINWRSVDNPKFPIAEWNRLKEISDPVWFAQEYEGKFVGFGGSIFQHTFNPDVHMWDGFDYDPDKRLYCGMDFGINNPCVTTFAQIFEKPEEDESTTSFLGIINELWLQGMDMYQVMPRVLKMYNQRPKYIACDPAGKSRDLVVGRSCVDVMRKEFHITPRYKDKWNTWPERLKGITEIHKLLRTNTVYFHPRVTRLQEALESLSYPAHSETAGVLDEVYVKDGVNDHSFESFLYLTFSKPIIIDAMETASEESISQDGQYAYLADESINRYTGFH